MAEHDEEKSKGFKVDDRRRFSSEGDLKPEHQREEAKPSPSQPPPDASARAQSDAAKAYDQAAAVQQEKHGAHEDELGEINFATFIVGLSTQALLHLGEITDPSTNQPMRDLPAAQQVID